MIKGISHFAIVVPDTEQAFEQYQTLGFKEYQEGTVTIEEKNTIAKLIHNGSTIVELLSKANPEEQSDFDELLMQKKYGLDHICYYSDNLIEDINALKKKRFIPLGKVFVSPVWNKSVVLMGHRKMGLIELIEE